MNNKQRRKKMKEHNDPLAKESSVSENDTGEQQDPATIVRHHTDVTSSLVTSPNSNVTSCLQVSQFKRAEVLEVESMRELRHKNMAKEASNDSDVKYCICKKVHSGFMLQCELCKDWFHSEPQQQYQ